MKNKVVITRENYRQIMLKRAIISCWVVLVVCFIIKLFGGNFFAIVCNNEKFIRLCEYIDKSVIYYILGYISFMLTSIMLLLIVKSELKINKVELLLFIIFCSIYWFFKLFVEIDYIHINVLIMSIIDYSVLYLLLFCFSKKPIKPIIAIILMFIFTILSVLTKNIGIMNKISDSALIAFIFMIDYYIMLILTFLYFVKFKKGDK